MIIAHETKRKKLRRSDMKNCAFKIITNETCRPYGAWVVGDAFTINMPLLTELETKLAISCTFTKKQYGFRIYFK